MPETLNGFMAMKKDDLFMFGQKYLQAWNDILSSLRVNKKGGDWWDSQRLQAVVVFVLDIWSVSHQSNTISIFVQFTLKAVLGLTPAPHWMNQLQLSSESSTPEIIWEALRSGQALKNKRSLTSCSITRNTPPANENSGDAIMNKWQIHLSLGPPMLTVK